MPPPTSSIFFTSPLFNSTVAQPYFINDTCFGDDVAAWLKPRLGSCGYQVEDPGQEDWGWYLEVRDRDSGITASVNIGRGGGEDETAFQIFVTPRRGLWAWLRWRSHVAQAFAIQVSGSVAEILHADPDITITT